MPLALQLLKRLAAEAESRCRNDPPLSLHGVSAREIRWLLAGGFGPMLLKGAGRQEAVPERFRTLLISADLSARVRHECLVETAVTVINVCRSLGVPVTLLKGISTSEEFYSPPHLRPMGDVDVLVTEEAQESVECALLEAGFVPDPHYGPVHEHAHHRTPLLLPRTGGWVEVHCRLFPASDDLYSQRLFEPRALTTALVPSRFRDKEVFRFSHEYQLLYMCTSWMRDLTLSGVHPTLLWSLVDLVHLLHHRSKPIDWGYLTALLGDDMTAAHVGVALDYATRRGLGAPPPAFIAAVQAHQALVGAIQRKLVHGMLDHYLLGARDWRLPFPLPVPGRYNAARQLRKRPHRGAPR